MGTSSNSFLTAIAAVCRKHPVSEKWILAPSLRIGAQWVDQVAWSGQPVLNLRVKTLRSIALELAGPELISQGLTLLADRGAVLVVDRLFARLRHDLNYFAGLEPGTRLAQTLHRSLKSLRLSGLKASDLSSACFETASKGRDIALLLEAYEQKLAERGLADTPDVLRLAATRLQDRPDSLPADLVLLLPDGLESSRLERSLIQSFGSERVISLAWKDASPPAGRGAAVTTDLKLLRFFRAPADAPAPAHDGSVQFFAAMGEVNEVREVLRRASAQGIRLDQIELLHTDSQTYVPLIHETLLGLAADSENGELYSPATFAEGIPCRYGRPGRALAAWVAWMREDCPQSTLVKMIREGLVESPALEAERGASGEGTAFSRLALALRSVGIGFGRERYIEKIDERTEALALRVQGEEPAPADDEDDAEGSSGAASAREQLAAAKELRVLVARLLEHTPAPGSSAPDVLEKASGFLERVARSTSELDQYSRNKLLDEVRDMARWIVLESEASSFDALEWLGQLPGRTSVMGSGPRPGCLHVAHVLSGGHSGRPHTYVVGLDDSRFPRSGLQDPLLLDAEKKALSSDLPTSGDKLSRDAEEVARLLERIPGRATFSFSKLRLADDSELFPGPALLTLWRLVSGEREADASTLTEKPGWEVAAFAPPDPRKALNVTECWLSSLCGPKEVTNRDALLEASFPHLRQGREAAKARLQSSDFTEFDGWVPAAGGDLDPTAANAAPLSASGLETAGKCPLRYFFKYGLRLEKPEDLEVDPDRWLDPRRHGKLLHLVFEEFLRELIRDGLSPQRGRDRSRIGKVLEKHAKRFRQLYPPPNGSAYERQLRELRRTVETFLVEEEEYAGRRNARPVYLEASLGMAREGHESGIDCVKPIDFQLSGGQRIRIRGRIDRIDLLGGGALRTYAIWDYKTGSAAIHAEEKSSPRGRVLQPALYVSIVEHELQKKVSQEARVAFFGFFFPGVRAEGERIEWTSAELAGQRLAIEKLCEAIRTGVFLATTDAKECSWCDYVDVCGDPDAVTLASKVKLAGGAKPLQPLRELWSPGD